MQQTSVQWFFFFLRIAREGTLRLLAVLCALFLIGHGKHAICTHQYFSACSHGRYFFLHCAAASRIVLKDLASPRHLEPILRKGGNYLCIPSWIALWHRLNTVVHGFMLGRATPIKTPEHCARHLACHLKQVAGTRCITYIDHVNDDWKFNNLSVRISQIGEI